MLRAANNTTSGLSVNEDEKLATVLRMESPEFHFELRRAQSPLLFWISHQAHGEDVLIML